MQKATKSKKKILSIALILALGAAMYVNWYYTKPAGERTPLQKEESVTENLGEAQYVNAQEKTSYFDDALLRRSKAHAEAKDLLQKSLETENITPEVQKEITESIEKLAKKIKLESDVENLIAAKTGSKSIVILEDDAQVILEKEKLNQDTALQIKEIILSHTKISPEKITLVEVK